MNELNDIIVAEVQRQASTEAMQAHITKSVESCVKAAIDNALRWGKVQKQIEEAVTQSLAMPDGIGLPAYGHMVLGFVRKILDERLDELLSGHIAKQMEDILKIGRREIRLSELVDEIRKPLEEDGDRHGSHISVHVEQSYPDSSILANYRTISIDTRERVKPRDCALRIWVTGDGTITSLILDGKDASKQIRIGALYGFERDVFALYATSGKLIVDDEEPSTSIGDI